jgi:hypothetical protein
MITEEKILLLPGAFPASNYESFWRSFTALGRKLDTRLLVAYFLLFITKALFSYEFLLITLGAVASPLKGPLLMSPGAHCSSCRGEGEKSRDARESGPQWDPRFPMKSLGEVLAFAAADSIR